MQLYLKINFYIYLILKIKLISHKTIFEVTFIIISNFHP
jgi:hypothetical protein